MKRICFLTMVAVLVGCSDKDDQVNGTPDGDGGGRGGSGADGSGSGGRGGTGTGGDSGVPPGTEWGDPTGITDGGWMIPPELLLCGDRPCECADGIDNDGDGVADGFDTECTGPNDDDEATFATGIPGDNRDPKWQDCFFDGNSGAGEDGCRYHTDCLTDEVKQMSAECALTDMCREFCAPRTPNGCDCFGCCTILDDKGEEHNVLLTADCQTSNLDACDPCIPTDQCGNTCGECELCPGKTVSDLPESCYPPTAGSGGSGGTGGSGGSGGTSGSGGTGGGGVPIDCPNNAQICLSAGACPGGHYCSYGCCIPLPVE